MKVAIPFRIVITEPLGGVTMMVQRGRHELLPPVAGSKNELRFEFEVDADISGAVPNFLGKFAQGPKDARFVYVNSGKQAGQFDTCWDRRAKLSLMTITREQVEQVINGNDLLLETSMPGIGKDGGPTCASVKGIEWRVVKR